MSNRHYKSRIDLITPIEAEGNEKTASYVEKYYSEATAFLDKAFEELLKAGAWKSVIMTLPNKSEEFWKALQIVNWSSDRYNLKFQRRVFFRNQVRIKSLEEQDWN